MVADHPYVILTAPWVDIDQREAADDFLGFLLAPDQQDRFGSLGVRNHRGDPGSEISEANGLLRDQPTAELDPPGGEVLRAIRDGWTSFRKRARLLIVMDMSASMSSTAVPGTEASKLDLAKVAALEAIDQLAPDDEVGLWVFSPETSQEPYIEVVQIDRVSTNAAQLRNAITRLSVGPDNRSELYATVRAATTHMRTDLDPTRINGVVLLSDGPDERSSSDVDLAAMMDVLAPTGIDDDVRFFTIAFGDQADSDLLKAIAQASLGTAYDATEPADIIKAFTQAVANF